MPRDFKIVSDWMVKRMDFSIRPALLSDREQLQFIWKSVFGDSDKEVETFFDTLFDPNLAIVANVDSGVIASGYIIPAGTYLCSGHSFKCGMIYAVGTLPEFRGHGYASEVTRALIATGYNAGYEVIVLCPSDDSLFEFYSTRSELREWFFIHERIIEARHLISEDAIGSIKLTSITQQEYNSLRNRLLADTPHIELDLKPITYQNALFDTYGGGFYQADSLSGLG